MNKGTTLKEKIKLIIKRGIENIIIKVLKILAPIIIFIFTW